MPYRIPFVLLAVVNLLIRMWAGLLPRRLATSGSPLTQYTTVLFWWVDFFTTLIALER